MAVAIQQPVKKFGINREKTPVIMTKPEWSGRNSRFGKLDEFGIMESQR